MVCKVADHKPLVSLREELGLTPQCHSLRDRCIHGYMRQTGDYTMGIPGAALGYCQALFNRAGGPEIHTEEVTRLLSEIDAPWAKSHELYWGNRQDETPAQFVEEGMRPLWGSGRVPILITELDPAKDMEIINSIVAAKPAVYPGEVVLIRLALSSQDSISPAVDLVNRLLSESLSTRTMPAWWPLFQSGMDVAGWGNFKEQLGDAWKFMNLAVNAFTPSDVFEYVREQVTVAQVPVGLAEGISADGTIQMAKGMVRLTNAPGECASYSLPDYMERLTTLETAPTLIVLGPSLPEWDEATNQKRIAALLPHLKAGCDKLWGSLAESHRDMIWGLAA